MKARKNYLTLFLTSILLVILVIEPIQSFVVTTNDNQLVLPSEEETLKENEIEEATNLFFKVFSEAFEMKSFLPEDELERFKNSHFEDIEELMIIYQQAKEQDILNSTDYRFVAVLNIGVCLPFGLSLSSADMPFLQEFFENIQEKNPFKNLWFNALLLDLGVTFVFDATYMLEMMSEGNYNITQDEYMREIYNDTYIALPLCLINHYTGTIFQAGFIHNTDIYAPISIGYGFMKSNSVTPLFSVKPEYVEYPEYLNNSFPIFDNMLDRDAIMRNLFFIYQGSSLNGRYDYA